MKKNFVIIAFLFFFGVIFFPFVVVSALGETYCFSDNNTGIDSCGHKDKATCDNARLIYLSDNDLRRSGEDVEKKIKNISDCRPAIKNSSEITNPVTGIDAQGEGRYGDKEKDPALAEKEGRSFSLVWECASGVVGTGGCDFNDVISQIQKLINYGFFMVLIFLPVLITYAGFIYVSASWKGEKDLGKAKAIFKNTAIAYAVAAAAWAIVHFVLDSLVVEKSFVEQINTLIQ